MKDYLGNDINVGDTILMSNLSFLEEHVIISIPKHGNSITVSTKRYRLKKSWGNKQTVWYNERGCPIASHDSKITKWFRSERIIKLGTFDGDFNQFKTIRQLEKEYQENNK